MSKNKDLNRVLIIGASGYIGNVIYRELLSYFKTFGTYCSSYKEFKDNKVFFKFCVEEDSILSILEKTKPSIIISSLRGDFKSQYKVHQDICNYLEKNQNCRLLFLSSASIFDGKFELPSYEFDKPEANSEYGKFKISVEKLILETIPAQVAILRLPMVLGVNSPRLIQLRQAIKNKVNFEVYPNLIISLTTADKIAQQVHYIINKKLDGIFHLASNDMVHHEDLFREITEKISEETPIFKSVFSRNEDSYLAILPKKNKLPEQYRITVAEVIDDCTLNEEIVSYKN